MRTCKVCNQTKPYDATQPKPKARGFVGFVCWSCYVIAQRQRTQSPELMELRARNKASAAQLHALVIATRIAKTHARIEAREATQEQLYNEYQATERAKNARRIKQQDAQHAKQLERTTGILTSFRHSHES